MKKVINRVMVAVSLRPYKSITLPTGLIVDHYKNGDMIAEYRINQYGVKVRAY